MQIAKKDITRTCPEMELIDELLQLDGKQIIELGCGKAEITRMLATGGPERTLLATEVDTIQHEQHQKIDDLPNVTFSLAGAEAIPAPDDSADIVFMFKSLHHVPEAQMDLALTEIRRVLRPGGYAWISEPIFAGDFNEILRLFHDEEQVRKAAFEAVRRSVENDTMQLKNELFFNTPMHFSDFADYDSKVLQVTHSDHRLSDALYETVRQRFMTHMQPDGAHFAMPIRVDLLQKAP